MLNFKRNYLFLTLSEVSYGTNIPLASAGGCREERAIKCCIDC